MLKTKTILWNLFSSISYTISLQINVWLAWQKWKIIMTFSCVHKRCLIKPEVYVCVCDGMGCLSYWFMNEMSGIVSYNNKCILRRSHILLYVVHFIRFFVHNYFSFSYKDWWSCSQCVLSSLAWYFDMRQCKARLYLVFQTNTFANKSEMTSVFVS